MKPVLGFNNEAQNWLQFSPPKFEKRDLASDHLQASDRKFREQVKKGAATDIYGSIVSEGGAKVDWDKFGVLYGQEANDEINANTSIPDYAFDWNFEKPMLNASWMAPPAYGSLSKLQKFL